MSMLIRNTGHQLITTQLINVCAGTSTLALTTALYVSSVAQLLGYAFGATRHVSNARLGAPIFSVSGTLQLLLAHSFGGLSPPMLQA